MRLLHKGFVCAALSALALGLPANILAQGGQQTAPRDPQSAGVSQEGRVSSTATGDQTNRPTSPSAVEETASAELPDSPGAVQIQLQNAPQQQQQQSNTSSSSTVSSPQSPSSQSATPQNSKPQRPVGTAAAEAPNVSGITAAQPAGVAIAPAKQRRVRTLVVKVGAIVGAGVAVGTTLALTMGTSSKPPGAH
jgi:cytoskeletal protein RodZ